MPDGALAIPVSQMNTQTDLPDRILGLSNRALPANPENYEYLVAPSSTCGRYFSLPPALLDLIQSENYTILQNHSACAGEYEL
jgi:hypothetical protein